MDCKQFQEKINDFIFDKIEYSTDIEEFLEHYRQCGSCRDDLKLYYMVRRGLGDVESPMNEEMSDVNEELELLVSYYEDLFRSQRVRKRVFNVATVIMIAIFVAATILFMIDI